MNVYPKRFSGEIAVESEYHKITLPILLSKDFALFRSITSLWPQFHSAPKVENFAPPTGRHATKIESLRRLRRFNLPGSGQDAVRARLPRHLPDAVSERLFAAEWVRPGAIPDGVHVLSADAEPDRAVLGRSQARGDEVG